MSEFIIKQDFLELFPEATIGVVVAKGIENRWEELNDPEETKNEIQSLLKESFVTAGAFLTEEVFSENTEIKMWREAFRKFKTKKGARCALEAMLKRVDKGNPPGSINPLVDIYNSVSLTYALPCGGENIDSFKGDLLLTVAEGGEDFLALGDEKPSPALPGEVIYKDDEGAVCRCWNWRDGQRTMLTEETKNAFLILEAPDHSKNEDLNNAVNALSEHIKKYLGGKISTYIMDKDTPAIEL